MKIITELKEYLKNINTEKYSFNTPAEKRKFFLRVFLTYFLVVFGISIIIGIIRLVFKISFSPSNLETPTFWFINIFAFPILEETAFRLPLIYKRLNLSLSVLLLSYYTLSIVLVGDVINMSDMILTRMGLSVFIAVLTYFIVGIKTIGFKVKEFWENHYKIIFYTLLLLFTFRHLDSYMLTSLVFLFSPLLLLPQFIGGVFFSFTRVRLGFIYVILLHMMINFIVFTPRLILYYAN